MNRRLPGSPPRRAVCFTTLALLALVLTMPSGISAQAAAPVPDVYLPHLMTSSTPAGSIPEEAYFVSPDGDDSNPGTEERPWRTIGKAAGTLRPGETVLIKAGTYHERVIPSQSGAEGQYITYAAYPGHTVYIDGSGISFGSFQGLFHISGKSYIKVSGLTIMDSAWAGLFADRSDHIVFEKNHTLRSGSSGIGIWYSSNVVVDGNDVENSGAGGAHESITLGGVDGFEVKHNEVHNEVAEYRKEGIDAKEGSRNGKIFGNDIHHVQAVAIYVDAWNQHTYNIEIFDNIVHDTSTIGFGLASEAGGLLENVKLYNNQAYNNKYCGVSVFGAVTSEKHPMRNIQIVNNTFYNNGWGGCGSGIKVSNTDIQGFIIRNNILSKNADVQIQLAAGVPRDQLVVDHNLLDGAAGDIAGAGDVSGDPLFHDAAAGNLHLQDGSPAIDRGVADSAPTVDCEGSSRPVGAGIDIGAHEYGP